MAERQTLNGTIKASIGGVEYVLRLDIGDIEAVEQELDTGLPVLLGKLRARQYQLRELRTILERAFRSAGNERITREQIRALLKGKCLPDAFAAVERLVLTGLDMGPIEADGDQSEKPQTGSPSADTSNSASAS